jgi:hypothetical protein
LISKNAIDRAVIVTKLRKLRLNRAHGWITRVLIRSSVGRVTVVVILVIIVWVVAAVIIIRITRVVVRVRAAVIVRIVARGVIRIIIPWVESPPGTADEDKNAIVIKVRMPFVPIVMPVAIMSRKRVVP